MTHKKITTSNGIVHYWIKKNITPNSRCIIFTHGVTADHTMFEKQLDYFAREFTIITWDIPLHGLSIPYKNFSFKNIAQDLYLILEMENIHKVILVGASLGGYPSQMFGHLYPHIVEGFVAVDTTPFGKNYYSKWDLWWLKQVKPMIKLIPNSILRYSMAKSISETEYSYNKMMEILRNSSKSQISDQMDVAYNKFAIENIDMVFSFPVLILLGEKDKTGKIRKYCKLWSQKTGYTLTMIENASHFSNGDNPEQVNSHIMNFIKNLE